MAVGFNGGGAAVIGEGFAVELDCVVDVGLAGAGGSRRD